ncbi:MAG: hypothetical protein ACRDTU_06105 [Micromonosporaceae bacterium]
MDTSMFAFTTDFSDQGTEVALDHILDQGQVTGVTVAAAYHTARDLFPHATSRKLRYLTGGVCYFQPRPEHYRDTVISPVTAAEIGDADPLAELGEATRQRGASLHAWVVFLHNSRAGTAHPECAQRTLYGDPQLTSLCPANPQVRRYAVALARDLARYGCDSLVAESLHYHRLRHGYHHERYLVRLDPFAEFALGLCFCAHCRAGASAAGIDIDAVVRHCRAAVDAAFAGASEQHEPEELTRDGLARRLDGEFGAFLEFRSRVVTGLVAEVAEALAGSGAALTVIDPGGGSGFLTGELTGPLAATKGWAIGLDPASVAESADRYLVLGYTRDPRRLGDELAAYRKAIGSSAELRCALRPTWPDCVSVSGLRDKLAALRQQRVSGADFYHHGLMPLACTARVGQALTSQVSEGASR